VFNITEIIKIMLILIILAFLLLEAFSIYIVIKFSHPISLNPKPNIEEYNIENYEKVSFCSLKGNISLAGYLITNTTSTKTIIVCHGYGDSKFMVGGRTPSDVKVDHLKLAKLFLDQGFNTLLFDFRGHGSYAGKTGVTIGFNEQQDLLGAINFVKSRGIGDAIGLIGFSMGAATALSILNKTANVNFVIADSPFSDLRDYLKSNMKIWTGLPDFPFVPMIILNFKLIYGVDYSTVSPLKSLNKSDIPILLIHGKRDTTIPHTESIAMKKLFKNNKSKLVMFDDSSHVGSYSMYGKRYEEILKNFLSSIS
jgi:Dipeptidyl aminopeptidases/acylaminoacyl-peptidases